MYPGVSLVTVLFDTYQKKLKKELTFYINNIIITLF